MESPLVSVIIPNYNYAHYLPEAIGSVLDQTYKNIEIIVVDDGSSDDSRSVIESYSKRIKGIFQANQGVSLARNNGVAASTGEYLAFLDADDAWLPRKIEAQMERFIADPALGMVHVAVDEVDAVGNVIDQKLNGLEGHRSADFFMLTIECVFGGGSGIVVPRRVFDEVGGFDTRMSTSADWDFFCGVSGKYPVGFVADRLLKYRVHSSNMHGNVGAMEHDMRLAFEKAFGDRSTELSRRSFGNLYKTLAGSYFRGGRYLDFVRSAFLSLVYRPGNLLYFVKFPRRKVSQNNGS